MPPYSPSGFRHASLAYKTPRVLRVRAMEADTCPNCARSLVRLPEEARRLRQAWVGSHAPTTVHASWSALEKDISRQVFEEARKEMDSRAHGFATTDPLSPRDIEATFVDTTEGPGLSGPMGGRTLLSIRLRPAVPHTIEQMALRAVNNVVRRSVDAGKGMSIVEPPAEAYAASPHGLLGRFGFSGAYWDAEEGAWTWDITWG